MSADFVKGNEKYVAEFGDKGSIPIVPAKKLTIVTCMDTRLEQAYSGHRVAAELADSPQSVFAQLGIKEGDAHIIRIAGGVAKDALRSIIISQHLLGTREIAVIHHTDCGITTVRTPDLRARVKAADTGNAALGAVDKIDFLEFADVEQSVHDDVRWLKEHPLVLPQSQITGWVYEVETGRVRQIV